MAPTSQFEYPNSLPTFRSANWLIIFNAVRLYKPPCSRAYHMVFEELSILKPARRGTSRSGRILNGVYQRNPACCSSECPWKGVLDGFRSRTLLGIAKTQCSEFNSREIDIHPPHSNRLSKSMPVRSGEANEIFASDLTLILHETILGSPGPSGNPRSGHHQRPGPDSSKRSQQCNKGISIIVIIINSSYSKEKIRSKTPKLYNSERDPVF